MDEGTVAEADELARLRDENTRLRQQLELSRTAHHYLEMMAHRFSGEDASLESPEQIRAFCQRIVRSLEILIQEVKELLSGRKGFQKEFGLESVSSPGGIDPPTAEFRLRDLHGDLGRWLFDWRTTSIDDESSMELRSAIDELKHHQMALIAGYTRSSTDGVFEVIKPLAPEAIRAEVIGGQGTAVSATFWRLNPLLSLRLWREYQRRYQELVREDGKRLETRLRVLFRQGYREYMRAKITTREAAQHSSGKGGQ